MSLSAENEGGESPSPLLEIMRKTAVEKAMCVYSICEIKDGISRTVNIVPSSHCHNCYSVAKVFVVAAIGILEDRGLLATEDLVWPLFKNRFPENFDEKWTHMKICHLLQHRAGFPCGYLDIDLNDIRSFGNDFLDHTLRMSLAYEPGTDYSYSDGAYYLLSRIVTEKSGSRLDDFLIRELFIPMEFQEYAFSKCPMGYPVGATGLYIMTSDMAKLGLLFLRGGVFNKKRLLSERFVKKALGQFELLAREDGGFSKGGMNGQILYLNPDTGRVIAIHSHQADIPELFRALQQEKQGESA